MERAARNHRLAGYGRAATRLSIPVIVSVAALLATARASGPAAEEAQAMMRVTTSAFDDGRPIPSKHTCEGEDLSPPLSWSDAPAATKSFVLIMDDPDAPPGTWVHWVLYDIPAGTSELAGGIPERERLDDGAVHGQCWGVDRFSRIGYHGPCPPPGSTHRYFFKLYALDRTLDLAPRATKHEVETAMKGHVLAEARIVGTYRR